jgi:hypothetical protein
MTILEALQSFHRQYEGNTDYPDSSSEDFVTRLEKANGAIGQWEKKLFEGIFWKELFTPHSAVTTMDSQSDAAENFLFPGSSLYIGSIEYKFCRPELARKKIKEDQNARIFWVTGTSGAYKININPAPGIGVAVEYDYYRKAFRFNGSESTQIEMSDPEFVVHWMLAQIFTDDENTTQAGLQMDLANEKMQAMQLANEMTPFYQDDTVDLSDDRGFGI